MISVRVYGQKPGRSQTLEELEELAQSARYRQLKVAVAYASEAGCREFARVLDTCLHRWADVRKRWLVGIDFGITEPSALDWLANLTSSSVRVPNARTNLASGLSPTRCFHSKVMILERGPDNRGHRDTGILVGSSNLTLAGLCSNIEAGANVQFHGTQTDFDDEIGSIFREQIAWWQAEWNEAHALTPSLLSSYRRERQDNEGSLEESVAVVRRFSEASDPVVEPRDGIPWSQARCFWVQVESVSRNRGPRRPGNQLDLRKGTRVFFGFPPDNVPPNTVLGQVTVRYSSNQPRSVSIRFGDNHMDKINLPIPGDDGPPTYENAYWKFERSINGNEMFVLERAEHGAERDWRERSQGQGLYYQLASGREFGFYS